MRAAPVPARSFIFVFAFIYLHQKVTMPPFRTSFPAVRAAPTLPRNRHAAVIVFDLLEAVSADHAVTEGARKVVGVMHRDARKFAATGGWGFEGFAGDSLTQRVVGPSAAIACFACHQAKRDRDFVFSEYRP
jgi:hypothetical protein